VVTTARVQSVPFVQVKRTAADKEKLVKPGTFGANGAADKRRVFFDFWNEQVIREDLPIGTVFMGDSITELWNLPVYFTPALGEITQNRGISGDLASVMARRFEADVIQLRPRNVVILAGTNDVSDMVRADKSDEEIVSGVTASIESMMDAAKAADIKVLVCSILPTNEDYRMHTQRTELRARINERLQAACKAKGCIYVDYASQMSDANGALRKNLARDGLHPHYAGYEIMARVLKTTAKVNGVAL
jgi:lysophospholipase L1-like esterase